MKTQNIKTYVDEQIKIYEGLNEFDDFDDSYTDNNDIILDILYNIKKMI